LVWCILRSGVATFDATELSDHFARHRDDFPAATTEAEYEQMADDFLAGPARRDLMECRRKGGDKVRYCTTTSECAVLSAGGIIRTYFKPRPCHSLPKGVPKTRCHNYADNIQYFKETCLRW
jgi:hypothetical protein